MNRDPLPFPTQRQLSRSTGFKFIGLVDAVAKHNEPTTTQLDALERSYNATADYIMASPEFQDLILQVHSQGSRALGTLIRPMRDRAEGFDIDTVMRLKHVALLKYGHNPAALINDLYAVVKRYADMHGLALTRWERCVTLEYAGGMCVDITPIIEDPRVGIQYGGTHARVPDRSLKRFDVTNPKGLCDAFSDAARVQAVFTLNKSEVLDDTVVRGELEPLPEAAEVQSRLLSRLVQLLKLHRNVAFGGAPSGPDASPKSVFITVLAATAYAERAPVTHDSPLDLLLDIVDTMPLLVQCQRLPGGGEYWELPNHTAPGDNLASGMNTPQHQQAYRHWHLRLKADLESLLQCIEQRRGLDELLEIVQRCFGARAAQAVRELEAPRPVPHSTRRLVTVGTAGAGALVLPSRGHTFYGD